MSYTRTKSQLNAIFAGCSDSGFITPAKFKKLTTPPAFRVFREYMRPHCPFRHYLHLRHNPYFDKYLKIHRRKRHPILTKPLLNLASLKHLLKNMGQNPPCTQTLKMQNKPKLKSAQIPVSPSAQRTNKSALQTPQPKNKPKQSQIKARRRESPDYSHDVVCCHLHSKKMTSKPNFKAFIITVSDYSTIGYCSLMTADCLKSKPKQSQFIPPRSPPAVF